MEDRPVRVLIVEDDIDMIELVATVLRRAGCDVTATRDGMKGVEEAKRARFDVAIIDLGLPHLGGHELGRHLRDSDEDLRLIALTGDGRADAKAESARIGFDAHFVKPAPLDALVRRVRELAGREAS